MLNCKTDCYVSVQSVFNNRVSSDNFLSITFIFTFNTGKIFNLFKRKDSEKKIFEITPVLRLFISKEALFKKIRLKKIPLEIVYVRKINGYRIYVDIGKIVYNLGF